MHRKAGGGRKHVGKSRSAWRAEFPGIHTPTCGPGRGERFAHLAHCVGHFAAWNALDATEMRRQLTGTFTATTRYIDPKRSTVGIDEFVTCLLGFRAASPRARILALVERSRKAAAPTRVVDPLDLATGARFRMRVDMSKHPRQSPLVALSS